MQNNVDTVHLDCQSLNCIISILASSAICTFDILLLKPTFICDTLISLDVNARWLILDESIELPSNHKVSVIRKTKQRRKI